MSIFSNITDAIFGKMPPRGLARHPAYRSTQAD